MFLTAPSVLGICLNLCVAKASLDFERVLASHLQQWPSLSFPGSAQFQNATERWTTFSSPSYWAAVSPATEEELANTVRLVTRLKIPFLATGRRHSYTTTIGRLQDGLAIDLSRLDSFSINVSAQTLTVGPGVSVGQIIDPVYNAGFDLQTGSAPCPSLIGVTLGGGVGRYNGVYGLMIDALQSVRMITADGRTVEASRTSNSELFWGIRGAGANFGVITSATYGVHPLVDGGDVFVVELIVPAERIKEYFELVESMSPIQAKLSCFMRIIYDSSRNKTQAQVQWTYKGYEDAARLAMASILNLRLEITSIGARKWNTLIDNIFGIGMDLICEDGIPRNLYSWNLRNYSADSYVAAFAKMDDFFAKYPGGRNSALQFEFFPNQAMHAVPGNETAYAWRDSTGYINFNILFNEGDEVTNAAATALGLGLRSALVATAGYPELTVFVNYAHGDETLEQIYGKDKLPRLAALKRKWDPNQHFSWNNGLPTRYPEGDDSTR